MSIKTDKQITNLPLVTIVTPSYNQGQFIEDTIKSVLSQEGDFFIEYIIADGGSTDNSVEIIKKYERLLKNKEYPVKCKGIDFYWWSRKDKGQSDAINQGFKKSKGDILAWINSDDFYEPGAFAYIVRKFNENPDVDLIYGDGCMLEEETKRTTKVKLKQVDFRDLLVRNCMWQPSVFFRRKVIEKVGYLDEKLHYAMDYDFWLRIAKNGKILYAPGKILSFFRSWGGSKTSLHQEEKLYKREGAENANESHFEKRIKEHEYLLEKYRLDFENYPFAYATQLRNLGTMYLIADEKEKAKECFNQAIKIYPSARNRLPKLISLFGRRIYLSILKIKKRFVEKRRNQKFKKEYTILENH